MARCEWGKKEEHDSLAEVINQYIGLELQCKQTTMDMKHLRDVGVYPGFCLDLFTISGLNVR